MKKRNAVFTLLMIAGIMLLTACKKDVGTDEDNAVQASSEAVTEQEYKFGFSCISMDNPYFTTLEASLREAVTAEGGTLITKDPALDVSTQISQIEEMIEKGINAIFLSPVDWEEIQPALVQLKEAKVKIINIDTHVKDTNYIDAYIGSDNKNAGFLCGQDLIERCPEGGKVVILEGTNVNSINDRITGFEEAISAAENGFTIAVRRDVQGDYEPALKAAREILQKEDDIVAIMCGNDQSALAALSAAESSTKNKPLIYGVDGSPDLKKELEKSETLVAGTSAQSPIAMGKEAAQIGMAILRGEKFEAETYTEVFFIDKSNVEMYGYDGWQ